MKRGRRLAFPPPHPVESWLGRVRMPALRVDRVKVVGGALGERAG